MKIIDELIKTFSNQPSFLSSKRIERFAVFAFMLLLTIVYVVKSIWGCSITATDLIIVVGTWLGYAGFNTVKIQKDVKNNQDKSEGN